MMNTLEPDQQDKLREMQRSWIHTRDLTCAFWYDYFQGTMANPMIAYCNNRETARRCVIGIYATLGHSRQGCAGNRSGHDRYAPEAEAITEH